MTTYLVTGASGNLGVFATQALLRDGGRVVAYDIVPNREAFNILLTPDERERLTVVAGDILDLEGVVRTIKTHRVELIAHLAVAATDMTIANPAHAIRVNVLGTNNMFEAAIQTGVKRVFFGSSGAVFGPKSAGPGGIIASDAPYDPAGYPPRDVYGGTKVMNEVTARVYSEQFGLETIGLRPPVYGPMTAGMSTKWIPQLVQTLLRGQPGTAIGGDSRRSWLYAEDTARAIVAALKVEPCPNTTFTISSESLPPEFHATNDDVIEMIRRAFPKSSISVAPPPGHMAPSPMNALRPDGHLVEELLRWKPRIGIEEGVRKIIDYQRAAIASTAVRV